MVDVAPASTLQFGSIQIGSRFGLSQGPLKVTTQGLYWKTAHGGKSVEIKKDDVEGLFWTKGSRSCQLGVRVKDGPTTNFVGFRNQDLDGLKDFAKRQLGLDVKDLPMSISGRSWGKIAINKGNLVFNVDGKLAMDLPLRDVSQAQVAKDDVMIELHVDDTADDDRQDVLTEISFHVPGSNQDFVASGSESAAKALLDQVLLHTDSGAASSDDVVCVFGDVAIMNPRGRFEVELHLNFLSLAGQTQDFKIRYTSIQRLFILPKANTPHTLVVLSLDPPIRKGQTYYTHMLCQFPSESEESIELEITDDQLQAKNDKCGGRLDKMLSGPIFEVFARALRGLSGAKISRPGSFSSAAGEPSIRCSYKADDGHLYPLDRAFFYIHKPPMLLPFDEVESVEFARQGGGAVSSRTFDLVVRMKNEAEHQFRSINRTEWQTLFDFFQAKKLRVENLNSAAQGPGGGSTRAGVEIDDDFDPGMRRAEAEGDSDADDEDFVGGNVSSSEDIDSDDDDGSDDDDSGSEDAEMVEEEGISVAAVMKSKPPGKRQHESAGGSGSSPAKKAKGNKADAGDKKAKKKKDPNAPKGAMSAFMYFSNENRSRVKGENPGIAFGEVAKLIGEAWKVTSAEDKSKYERMAAADKERYKKEMANYKPPAADDDDGFIVEDEEEAVVE